jgi:hypothetical protein
MTLYEDIVSAIHRGFERGIRFSVRHFWYCYVIGFVLACGIGSVLFVKFAQSVSIPKVYKVNPFSQNL